MKLKGFRCKKCNRVTSTTNENVYKVRLCGECRNYKIPKAMPKSTQRIAEKKLDTRENEKDFWFFAITAWLLAIMVFWRTLTFFEGMVGSVAMLNGVLAVWRLYKQSKR